MTELSIIIPAYNEEDRIVHTLMETIAYLSTRAHESEIIVVSDGSTDNTGKVVNGFEPGKNVHLVFLEYHPNRGKGYAVRFGMPDTSSVRSDDTGSGSSFIPVASH